MSLDILDGFSLEMTGKDVPSLMEAQPLLPAGTRVNVTYLGNEDFAMRRAAIRAVAALEMTPVPHISSRRLLSQDSLEEFLAAMRDDNTNSHVFVVGGDPTHPEGPYEDSLSVIRTGLLERYGVRTASISGYPEGHPDIPDSALWAAIQDKSRELVDRQIPGDIITQFSFDVDAVVAWIEQVRTRGIDLPIRIGVPGPAGVKRLLGFARRFGVASSAGIVKKYGLSLTNLVGTAGPDEFVDQLRERLTEQHGQIRLHFYTFGGLEATAGWVRDFASTRV